MKPIEILEKLRRLAERGATEGERAAARAGMQRIISKYNLDDDVEDYFTEKEYRFKYSTNLENRLFVRLLAIFTDKSSADGKLDTWGVREICIKLTREEYITIQASYEYFRAHMRGQWNKVCLPLIQKKRKAKTKTALRKELEPVFFTRYIIESNLADGLEIISREIKSAGEARRNALMRNVQGGTYRTQLSNGLFLESKNT